MSAIYMSATNTSPTNLSTRNMSAKTHRRAVGQNILATHEFQHLLLECIRCLCLRYIHSSLNNCSICQLFFLLSISVIFGVLPSKYIFLHLPKLHHSIAFLSMDAISPQGTSHTLGSLPKRVALIKPLRPGLHLIATCLLNAPTSQMTTEEIQNGLLKSIRTTDIQNAKFRIS
jgi:hypothetical protein